MEVKCKHFVLKVFYSLANDQTRSSCDHLTELVGPKEVELKNWHPLILFFMDEETLN